MAKLYLKFEQSVLKEFPLSQAGATIGRLPDNAVQVDNLAVSSHHARIYWDNGSFVLEDNGSLNGTFVNNRRVTKTALKDGDEVLIGKHTILFTEQWHEEKAATIAKPGKENSAAVPMLDATVILDTKKAREMIAHAAAGPIATLAPAGAPAPALAKERLGILTVVDGRTDQREYVLSGKLSVIGKSEMASIKLKGWFAPKVAAVINRRDGKYFLAPQDRKLKLNGAEIAGPRELCAGDTIQVGRVQITFAFSD